MVLRIGEYVLSGELRNNRRNGVFGWIEFAPDVGVRIELTGNLSGDLAGKHVRFHTPLAASQSDVASTKETSAPADVPETIDGLADRQIGVVGEMGLRPAARASATASGQQSLYLEWYSQNGQVVAELPDCTLEYLEDESSGDSSEPSDPLDQGTFGIGFTEIHVDQQGEAHTSHYPLGDSENDDDEEDDEPHDPYGLFTADLQRQVSESLGPMPDDLDEVDDDPTESPGDSSGRPRSWDEVMPGIDSETKAMYEQWDEIFEGKKDQPISYLFHEPLRLPTVDNVTSHEQAEPLVRAILAQLALLSVALDVCEHFEPMDTYRLLMTEILPSAKVHPNLAASEMVQHYSTSDFCQLCEHELGSGDAGDQTPDSDAN